MSSSRRVDPDVNESSSRHNVYFLPRDGIDREVITSDICRYLGNDALVRPGTYQDPATGAVLQGYHITGYRNLTTAMIQSLKEDSARWENERRSRTGGNNRKSGPSSASYPGSGAPGYSGNQQSQQYQQPQFDDRQDPRQPAYNTAQYQAQQTSQSAGDPRYMQHQQAPGGGYSNAPAYAGGAYAAEPPYHYVGAHSQHQPQAQPPSDRNGYPSTPYAGGPAHSAQGHDPRYGYAQPADPLYGRSNNNQYPATTQVEYASVPPVYGYDYQTANTTQTPAPPQTPSSIVASQDPRATTSSPVGTQAQTGYSAPSSSRHRDRTDRDHRDRHSRR